MSSTSFWNRHAKRYAEKPIDDEKTYQHKLEITRQYFTPTSSVLEIGCGTGSTALLHAPFVKSIYATDYSEKMIEIAQEKLNSSDIKNVDFRCTSAEELSTLKESFDAILALNVLHLIKDIKGSLDIIYKLLKPSGFFVSSTVCVGDFMKIMKFIGPLGSKIGLIPYINVTTRSEFEKLLLDTGFKVEYSYQPHSNKSLFIVAKK